MTAPRGSLYPADQLLAWLEQHTSTPGTLEEVPLRIPVFVTLTANRVNIEKATIGDKPDALVIKVNDRTLGVPIAGKLGLFFGDDAMSGMLWLQGLWRGGPTKEFQVTRVEGEVTDAERATAAAQRLE